jgi:hypothetical protein
MTLLRIVRRMPGNRTDRELHMGGLDDIVNKAKEAVGGDAALDEKIDQAAGAAKGVAPESTHGAIDAAATKAKEL